MFTKIASGKSGSQILKRKTDHEIIRKMLDGYLQDDPFQARIEEPDQMIASEAKAALSAFYTFEQ
ncbi:hypothetical protein [Paenibacillus ihuae]|uniref:hypothetical protein n=1 Tax=Paenibacillus ihuae TaxID=1232431 RepID=UPI00131BD762|nr:hypothetical protein [Paenibacillus ihuae]